MTRDHRPCLLCGGVSRHRGHWRMDDNITMSGSLIQHSILGYQAIDMGEPVQHDAPK